MSVMSSFFFFSDENEAKLLQKFINGSIKILSLCAIIRGRSGGGVEFVDD